MAFRGAEVVLLRAYSSLFAKGKIGKSTVLEPTRANTAYLFLTALDFGIFKYCYLT